MISLPHIVIDHPDDPRIAAYRDVRDRDLAGRDGFIAEGAVVLERLIASSTHRPQSVLIAAPKATGLEPLLRGLPSGVPVYSAGQAVMDAIVGFHIHRGVLAVGARAPAIDPVELLNGLPPKALVLALSGISNHDNMGGLFRNAAAFGAAAVLLDAQCCDPLYRKAIRVSVGAALAVPFARLEHGEDLADLLASTGFEGLALTPRGGETLADIRPASRMAAIFGAEGPGLPDAFLDRVRTVRIDMAGGFDSLNVATTSGIVLHHLARGGLA